jgi:hypothetical protein
MRRLAMTALLLAAGAGCGGDGGGGPWRTYSHPGIGAVTALWAFASDDVWVAGGTTTWHFDGSAFEEIPLPAPGAVADFWGAAPNDLYAVGGTRLMRWDGAAWSLVDFGGAVDPGALTAVWGGAGGGLWLGDAVDGRVFHRDGAAWSTTVAPTIVMLNDLWGAPEGPVYAGGASGLARWNGSEWIDVHTDGVAGQASGLWGFGPDDVWSASAWGTVAHWDGVTWTDRRPRDDAAFIDVNHAIWGPAPDDIWMVGDSGAIAHWNGTRWSQVQVGPDPDFPPLGHVHGSSASDVWAAGRNADGSDTGVVLHYEP